MANAQETQILDPASLDANFGRVWEGHRLGLAVARVFAGHQELDADTVLGVSQVFATLEGGEIATPLKLVVDCLQSLPCHEQIDIHGEPPEAVRIERHATHDDVARATR